MASSRTRSSAAPGGAQSPPSDAVQREQIAYQGEPGANSHLACTEAFPALDAVAYPTFEDALAAVHGGEVRYAMIPIENSVAGRVADIHHLLPRADLYIVGEHFLRVRHQLMAMKGASLATVKRVLSHTQALGQCRSTLRKLGLRPIPEADTAGSARIVAEAQDPGVAAIASKLAAEIYGLDILMSDVEDEAHNTTRFITLAKEPDDAEPETGPVITTFIFRVRNVPAALYKALGGFATNGVNMTKLESYQTEGTFNATMFFADIEGHPAERRVQLALEELSFFSSEVLLLGTYPASPYRAEAASRAAGPRG
jgi:prephenate dehydratase